MVEVTGDEDKIDGLVELLRPKGILEMVRTGRIAMVRGNQAAKRKRGTTAMGTGITNGHFADAGSGSA